MKKVVLVMLSMLAIVTTGCKKATTTEQGTIPITLHSTIANDDLLAGKSSRAIASKDAFVANDKIGIFVVPYKSMTPAVAGELFGDGNYADNVPFETTDGSTFAVQSGQGVITYPNATTKVDIYAFAMYNALYNNLGATPKAMAWNVDASQNTQASIIKNDIMTAATLGVTPASTAVTLNFKHRLAKAEITINVPVTFRGKNVTGATLYIDGTRLATTLDMSSPEAVASAPTGVVTPIEAYKAVVSGTSHTFEAIVVPQTISAGTLMAHLVLQVDGIGTQTLNCQAPTNIVYQTGTNSKIVLTAVDEYVLALNSINITQWIIDSSTPAIEAQCPARMIFNAAGTAAQYQKVSYATISIDDMTYTATVKLDGTKLICTYLQPATRIGDKLKGITFKQADGTTAVTATISPDPTNPATGINILGNPLHYNYATVIATATF
ncbi:MAG: fimbrillin family protein [Mucinivorans sp.]